MVTARQTRINLWVFFVKNEGTFWGLASDFLQVSMYQNAIK